MNKCIALITAAGNGTRMGKDIANKQFIELDDKPVLFYSVKAFSDCKFIDKIIITINEKDKKLFENFQRQFDFEGKKIELIIGGKTRQESVFNGIKAINHSYDYVFIHDGARPFITSEMIEKGFNSLIASGLKAGAFGVKIKDTIKLATGSIIEKTLNRDNLFSIQTPQIFSLQIYKELMGIIESKNLDFTDDCQIFEYFNEKVFIISSSYDNIKITTKEDITLGKEILKRRKNQCE